MFHLCDLHSHGTLLTAFGYDIAPVASAQQVSCNQLYEDGVIDTNTVEEFQMIDEGTAHMDDDKRGEEDDWGLFDSPTTGLEWDELCPLRNSFTTSFELYNDSAVGVRINMVTGWKYTFSVDLQPLNGSEERPDCRCVSIAGKRVQTTGCLGLRHVLHLGLYIPPY